MSEIEKVRADAVERAERAYEARLAGATWRQAAEIAGFTDEANTRRAVRRLYDERPAPDREESRHLQRDRLDRLYTQALKDVHDRRPGAVTACVRVIELSMRLDGLAEPDRLRVGYDPTDAEIAAFVEKVLGPARVPEETDILGFVEDAEIVE